MKKNMDVKKVASYTNLSPKTIYNLVYSKKIPFKRISEKKVIFYKDAIDKWLHRRKKEEKLKEEVRKSKRLKDETKKIQIKIHREKATIIKNLFTSLHHNYLVYFIAIILLFSLGWIGSFIYHKTKISSSDFLYITPKKSCSESIDIESLIDQAQLSDLQINYSFLEKDKVKIKLDYISNIEFKGDIKSAPIKPLLVYTLEGEKGSYATRSKAIDIIKPFVDDRKIRKALIHVMKNDESPALRMKAATVLTKVAKIEEVKEAILDRLINDKNEAVRYKALEIVEKIVDEQIVAALKNIKEKDKSDIIRNRAELILKKHNQKA